MMEIFGLITRHNKVYGCAIFPSISIHLINNVEIHRSLGSSSELHSFLHTVGFLTLYH